VLEAIDRNRIVAVVGNALVLIDTSGGSLKVARTIEAPNGTTFGAVAPFSNRHRVIASMGDKSLYVFSTDTGAEVRHIGNAALSSSIAVSPDDSLVAQVDALTGVVTIRDATTLRPLGRNLVAPGFVTDLTWLDDGRRLATASTDSTVHYWDIAERKQLAALPHGKKVEGVVAPLDGSTVYSAGLGLVREWNLSPARAARAACAEAGRNLTRDEWDTYLHGESYRPTCATTGGTG
jgi:WD40 repeat protein